MPSAHWKWRTRPGGEEYLRAAPVPRQCLVPAEAEFVRREVLEGANPQRGSVQAEPMLVFGGCNTCLAASLKTSTAGPFFPTLVTAGGNIYVQVCWDRLKSNPD